jgi:restriction system protein
MSLLLFRSMWGDWAEAPVITLHTLLEYGDQTNEGRLVEYVALPWFDILELIRKDPANAYSIDPRKWEEIIAGAYSRAGFDEVILTPQSGDRGRDVIATKSGVGSVRFLDQVKAYKPGHVVTADEVRSMFGVVCLQPNVSKGIITTTSTFAPHLLDDTNLARQIPHRLELKAKDVLFPWLEALARQAEGERRAP